VEIGKTDKSFQSSHKATTTWANLLSAALVATSTTHFQKLLSEDFEFEDGKTLGQTYVNIMAVRGNKDCWTFYTCS
jgi:hypothetical protein